MEALGFQHLEGQVLELPLDLPYSQPLRQRRVDLHRLPRDPELLVRGQGGERAHVVEPVRELDQDDPDVLRHRQEHLPDVLGLLLFVCVRAEPGQLGHAVHKMGHLGAEAVFQVRQAVFRVLRDVVQQGGLDRSRIDAQLGEDLRRRDRVGDVRLAGRPLLALMGFDREVEGAINVLEVGRRVMARNRFLEMASQRFQAARAGLRAPDGRQPPPRGRAGRSGALSLLTLQ